MPDSSLAVPMLPIVPQNRVVQEHHQTQTYLQQLHEVQLRAEAHAALHHQQASLEVAAVQTETQRQFQYAELEMAT